MGQRILTATGKEWNEGKGRTSKSPAATVIRLLFIEI